MQVCKHCQKSHVHAVIVVVSTLINCYGPNAGHDVECFDAPAADVECADGCWALNISNNPPGSPVNRPGPGDASSDDGFVDELLSGLATGVSRITLESL